VNARGVTTSANSVTCCPPDVLTVFELGFGDASGNDLELGTRVEASLHDIYARAEALLDQPPGEFLHIAMKPVARYTGELVNFTVGGGGAGLLFVGGNGDPDVMHPGVVQFVFVRPKPIAGR
jgi:hypothetical protein